MSTDPNHGFTHVYFGGHPSTDPATGAPVVVIDAIQIGEGMGSLPGNAAQIIGQQVSAYTQATNNCSSTSGQWNLQSAQFDLDSTSTTNIMLLDDVSLHFQP